jgi:tetratricopeptide (TPR) repeat protein
LLIDWWPLGRSTRPSSGDGKPRTWTFLAVEKLPMLVAVIVLSAVVVRAQGTAVAQVAALGTSTRLMNAVVAYAKYILQTFWPTGLTVFYPHPGESIALWQVLAAGALLVGVSVVAIAFRRRLPYLFVGWFWFVGTMVPMIGVVQVGLQQMSDRYTYFPCIGLYLAATWLVADWASDRPTLKRCLAPAAATVLVVLAGLSWKQVGYWRDSETLWRRALAVTTGSSVAHINLAQSLHVEAERDEDQQKLAEAIDHYEEALRFDPRSYTAHINFARALATRARLTGGDQKQDLEAAIVHYREGLRLAPHAPERQTVHFRLGNVLAELGRFPQAVEEFRQAIAIRPEYAAAHLQLGRVFADLNQFPQAIEESKRAIELEPDWRDAVNQLSRIHRQYGQILASQGNLDAAIEQLRRAVQLAPSSPSSRYGLAKALARKGLADEAIENYRQAVAQRPNVPEAHYELGVLLLERGQREAGVGHLRTAVRLRPDYREAIDALGRVGAGK